MSKVSNRLDLKKRTVYYHPNSINPSTQERRNKYKLLVILVNKLDIYGFIVATTKRYKRGVPESLTIMPSDFEEIEPAYSGKLVESYYCWDNCEVHKFVEIHNIFDRVGKINITTFEALKSAKINRRADLNIFSPRRHIVQELVASEYDKAAEIARRFGL
ncbi:hypothetical protein KBG23_00930 [Candidatus Dojkabacteria bacterium]|jgi:hypothetical protein|nr:hypothetical protein [Candidatus Dojkabacteria bacterium]